MSPKLIPLIHAHGRSDRLDGVLELVAYFARPRPLSVALDELPRRIARIVCADICSVYLLEGDELVMRGNVGFPSQALGEVRLGVGEGVTGLAVEIMRPISLDAAQTHHRYRHFPGLGEERFPVFLAVPIAGPSGPLGALVLQRRELPAFGPADVELATALSFPVAALADRARLMDALRTGAPGTGRGARRVTLSGRSLVPGRALGVIHPVPRPHALPVAAQLNHPPDGAELLPRALLTAQRTLQEAMLRSRAQGSWGELGPFLETLEVIFSDGRLRERCLELSQKGKGLAYALADLGAEALRFAAQAQDPYALQRATLMAEACEALAVFSARERLELPRGAVLVADQFTAFDLLVGLRCQPAGLVLAAHPDTPRLRSLAALLEAPVVAEVAGLFRWLSAGEIALVDGDHGVVRLNPARAEIAALRAEKRQRASASELPRLKSG